MAELKPCPFCGGESQFNIYETTCGVECEKCRIGTAFVLIDEYKQAIQAWNTRAERTCHIRQHGSLADWPEMVCWSCSECGFGWHHSTNDGQFSYCPNCGARVVE